MIARRAHALLATTLVIVGVAQADEILAPTPAVERVQWDKTPIPITLRVGVERRVTFPTRVQMGPPRQLLAHMTTLESIDDTLYLEAHAVFAPTRMLVRECTLTAGTCTPSGRTYIVILRAALDDGSATPVAVYPPAADNADPVAPADTPAPTPVALVRYAAQALYAPTRLLEDDPGIHRVALNAAPTTTLYRGGALAAHPQVAYTDGAHYVTAVLFKNQTTVAQPLDLRFIRGRWLSRTLVAGHAHLAPNGDHTARDAAVVFLVSPRPFEEVLAWRP